MAARPIQPFDHPAAWKSTDFRSKDDLAVDLTRRHITALEEAAARLKREGAGYEVVSPRSFPLPEIRADIELWQREVHEGRGLVLLRGFPVDQVEPELMRLMYIGLGSHFGRPVSQSNLGDLIGEVVNVGGKDKRERAYRNSRSLMLHTDRCDHIAMLCIRPAAEGGLSGYASALTIHNEVLRERPDLIEHLYRGYPHHRFGEQLPGDPPVTRERIPIFSVAEGVPGAIYIRGYINLAAEEGHVTLSEAELEALDLMDEVANRPGVRLNLLLEPGDVSLTNNCLLLHTRTAFEDAANPALKRHLLRLWLCEDGRPIDPRALVHKGSGGIAPIAGKGTYYRPAAG